ncbi:DNA polymerase III [Opitutaceae bacterium TAV5]|nr:DNA polymerase III [Opitutaceae bacterium TAV5]
MSWTRHLIHFVDFEGSLASGILEYGVVTIRDGGIIRSHTRLCRATGCIRAEDSAVHGLDAETVAAHALFHDDFELFAGFRESGPLAAHFAQAENSLIKSVWPYPRTSPDFAREGERLTDWGPWIDTGRLYPQLYDGLATAKLGELVTAFGLQAKLDAVAAEHCPPDRRRYHAALYDALAGALLLTRLVEERSIAERPLPWLLGMSTLDGGKRDDLWQATLF